MNIADDKLTEIILKLRAIEAKTGATDPDSGSNPIDDGAADVLVSGTGDASEREVRALIRALNEDERADLLALLYVGRGDMDPLEWEEALRFAREREEAGDGAAKELLSTPDAAGLLEEGLDSLAAGPDASEA